MQLTFHNNQYILNCSYEERHLPSKLGFKWDGSLNAWATQDWYKAWKVPNQNLPQLQKYNKQFISSRRETPQGLVQASHLVPFQQAGVEEIMTRKSRLIILADEQGLGKTLQVIEFLRVCSIPVNRKFIIIPPATLKINWSREIARFDRAGIFKVKILRGRKAIIDDPKTNVVIVNYDLLSSGIIKDQLMNFDAQVIVADEAHLIKNADALRTKAVYNIAEKALKFITVSGTPIPNRPIEIFGLLKKFSPETLGVYADKRRFEFKFCAGHESKWGFDNSGASNTEELGERLRATCMIRRLKKDVLKDFKHKLPPSIIVFEADKTTAKLVKREQELAAEFLKKNKEIPQIGEIAELRQQLALKKLPLAFQFIDEILLEKNKVVLFAHHSIIIDALKEHFAAWKPVIIRGGMTDTAKQKAVDSFQNDKSCSIFIGQIQAAGVGITLTAASRIVFVESSWSPGDIDQCIDRCDRIGQTESVRADFLTIEDSLEEHMLKVAFDKAYNINKIMG